MHRRIRWFYYSAIVAVGCYYTYSTNRARDRAAGNVNFTSSTIDIGKLQFKFPEGPFGRPLSTSTDYKLITVNKDTFIVKYGNGHACGLYFRSQCSSIDGTPTYSDIEEYTSIGSNMILGAGVYMQSSRSLNSPEEHCGLRAEGNTDLAIAGNDTLRFSSTSIEFGHPKAPRLRMKFDGRKRFDVHIDHHLGPTSFVTIQWHHE